MVPLFEERSNSCSPRSFSSRRTAWLTAGWVRCTLAAAREKLRSSATARKMRREVRSINCVYFTVIIITLTSRLAGRYNRVHESEPRSNRRVRYHAPGRRAGPRLLDGRTVEAEH